MPAYWNHCPRGDRARAWQVGPRVEALKRGPWHHRCWKQDPVKEDHSSTYFNIFQCKVYINFCQPIENHCPRGDRARASQVCPRVEALKRRPSHPRCWKQDPVTEDHSSTYFNIFQCKVYINLCQPIENHCPRGDRARAWQVGPRVEALKRGPWHHRCWKQDPVKEDHSSTYFNIFQCKVYINFCQPIENHCPRGDRARASQVCPRVEALKRRPSHPRCWKQDPVTEDHSSTYFNIFQCKVYINLCQPIENHCPRGDRARAWQLCPRVEALKRGPWHPSCWKQDTVKEDHSSTYFIIFQCKVYINFLAAYWKSLPTWRQGTCMTDWSSCRGSETWPVTSQLLKTRIPEVKEDHSSTYFNIFQCKVYINLCQPIEITAHVETGHMHDRLVLVSRLWNVVRHIPGAENKNTSSEGRPILISHIFQHISTYFNTKSRCLRLPSTSLPPYIIKCPYRGVAHEAELW